MTSHPHPAKLSFDGGDLDCGGGLLLLIRQNMDRLESGELLEILSTEISVPQDLPAWCRLTGNELVSHVQRGRQHSFLVAKGKFVAAAAPAPTRVREVMPAPAAVKPVVIPTSLPMPAPAPAIVPLAVMGVGSWPRPLWLLDALQRRLEGKLDEAVFESFADDAVRLCVAAQERAGVDVVTDGEQRRDSYASFVGGRLDNCQLVPVGDLVAYVDHPEEFAAELKALDVPPTVRHPAVFGPLSRARPIAAHEARFVRTVTSRPVKVALPGPYLLTRTMWLECVSDRAYRDREVLARDVVRVLREEIAELLSLGVAMVQLDEPVLTEVVFGRSRENRSFMCGALGKKLATHAELAFASELLDSVCAGFPTERLALHVCRGNWTPDESVALAGDYAPLLPLLSRARVGTLFLELCTPRAGDERVLAALPSDKRVGVGVVNQKHADVESVAAICAKAEKLIALLGAERVLLNPDCGFATFAANPISSAAVAEAKLAAMVQASGQLRARYRV